MSSQPPKALPPVTRKGLTLSGRLLLTALLMAASACTYTAAVTQTNIPRQRGHVVEAEVKKYIVLGLSFDNDDVLKLREQLLAKCKSGRIQGILTKDLRTEYLWIFFWARDTVVTGYCVGKDTASAAAAADGLALDSQKAAPLAAELEL